MASNRKPDSGSKSSETSSSRTQNPRQPSQNARPASNSSKPLFTVGVQSPPSQSRDLLDVTSQRTSVGGGGFYNAPKYANERLESQKTVGASISSVKAGGDNASSTIPSHDGGPSLKANSPADHMGSARTSAGGVDFFGASKHQEDDLTNANTKKAQATTNRSQRTSVGTGIGPSKQPDHNLTSNTTSMGKSSIKASESTRFPTGTQNAKFSEPSVPDFHPSTGSYRAVSAATSTGSRGVRSQYNRNGTASRSAEQKTTTPRVSVTTSSRTDSNSNSRPSGSHISYQQPSESKSASGSKRTQSQVSMGNKSSSSPPVPDGNQRAESRLAEGSQRTNSTNNGNQPSLSKSESVSQRFPSGDDNARFTSTRYSGRISQGPSTGSKGTGLSSRHGEQRSARFSNQVLNNAESAVSNGAPQAEATDASVASQRQSQSGRNPQLSTQRRSSERSNAIRPEITPNPRPVQANAQPLAGRASQATGGGWGGNQNFVQNVFSSDDNAQPSQAAGFGSSQNTTPGGSRRTVSFVGENTQPSIGNNQVNRQGDISGQSTGLASTPSFSTDPRVGNLLNSDLDGDDSGQTTAQSGADRFGVTSPGVTSSQASFPIWVTPSLANSFGSEIIAKGQTGYDKNNGGSDQSSPRFFRGQEDTDIANIISHSWILALAHPLLHDHPMVLVSHALADGSLVDFGCPAPGVVVCKASLASKWLVEATRHGHETQCRRRNHLIPLFIMGGFIFFALFDSDVYSNFAIRRPLSQGLLPAGIGPQLVEVFGLRPGCDRP